MNLHEEMILGKGLTKEGYLKFEENLAIIFFAMTVGVRLVPGFTRVGMGEVEDGKAVVVMANEEGQAMGMVKVFPVKADVSEPGGMIFTTASYVAPEYRGKGVLRGLLTEAEQVVASLVPRGEFALMMETLAFPDNPEYVGVRSGVVRLLVDLGYTATYDQSLFLKMVMGGGE